MTPDQFIYALVSGNAAAQAALGTDPVRFFPGGVVPSNVDVANVLYAVQQSISIVPVRTFETRSRGDNYRVQISAYGLEDDYDGAVALRSLMRDAIEDEDAQVAIDFQSSAQTIGGVLEDQDDDTHRWRAMIDFSVWVPR